MDKSIGETMNGNAKIEGGESSSFENGDTAADMGDVDTAVQRARPRQAVCWSWEDFCTVLPRANHSATM